MKPKPIIRIGAIVIKDNKVLAVQHNYKGELFWVPPGGGLEHGETIAQCAVREVKEETGLAVEFEQVLYIHDYITDDEHVLNIFVLAKIQGGFLRLGTDPDQETQVLKNVEFIPISNLKQITFYPNILKEKIIQGLPAKGSYLGNLP